MKRMKELINMPQLRYLQRKNYVQHFSVKILPKTTQKQSNTHRINTHG